MKTAYEIFEEFIMLSYNKDRKVVRGKLEDLCLGEYVLARKYNGTLTITYLTTGASIQFSPDLYGLLYDFAESRGKEILQINTIKKGDRASKFLVLVSRLFYLLRNKTRIQPDELLQKICETGSTEFRELCKKKFGIDLSPIIYSSIKNNLEQI